MKSIKVNSLADILDILHSLSPQLENDYRTDLVGIFGSFVRGEATKSSDIDLLVQPRKGATLIELIGLSHFLQKKMGRKVDVVSERSLKGLLKASIYRDLVKL